MAKHLSIHPDVIERLKGLPREERLEALNALLHLLDSFARPHVHAGLGIRKLTNGIFECRFGLALRFVFQDRESDLYVRLLGNHDEIKALLRRGSYK